MAPQVSKGKPGPANHWPEGSEVTLRQHHKRNTGNTVSAGVVGSRTGAVCKSRVTFMDAQLDTEPTYGSVQGKKKVENGNEQKDNLGRNRKLNNRALNKRRNGTLKRETNTCEEQESHMIHIERLGNDAITDWKKKLIMNVIIFLFCVFMVVTGCTDRMCGQDRVANDRISQGKYIQSPGQKMRNRGGCLMCPLRHGVSEDFNGAIQGAVQSSAGHWTEIDTALKTARCDF